jgi:outer membrane receptor protein involved in Fe transport
VGRDLRWRDQQAVDGLGSERGVLRRGRHQRLVNLRAGYRWNDGWSVFLWSRNLLDQRYYEFLTAQPGNSGLIVGLPGDPRTIGLTVRMNLRSTK